MKQSAPGKDRRRASAKRGSKARKAKPAAVRDEGKDIDGASRRRPEVHRLQQRADAALRTPALPADLGAAEEKWPLRRTAAFVIGSSTALWSLIILAAWHIV